MNKVFTAIFFFVFTMSYSQSFVDKGIEQGLFYVSDEAASFGNGLSFYDVDKNGWDDITFGRAQDSIRLFLNFEGEFEEVSINIAWQNNAKSVNWVDFDNDGDADLLVANHFGGCNMYRNTGDLVFEDITDLTGFFEDPLYIYDSYGTAWGDYDNDGLLDVYIANHCSIESGQEPVYNFLYHNNGDGSFTDVTDIAGVANGLRETFQGVWVDYDRDGLLDLHVINDKVFSPNTMYKNNGDGTFDDVSEELGLDLGMDAMSNTFTDFDRDGDLDLYLTNTDEGNILMRNDGTVFTNITATMDVEINAGCFSSNFFDMDNDMDEDFYVSTTTEFSFMEDPPNYAYINFDGLLFQQQNEMFPDNFTTQYNSAIGDYNNDGKPDLVGYNDEGFYSNLWKNTTVNLNRYIKVSLEGQVSNRDGIGSWIEVYADNIKQTKFTFCGEDYLTQDSQREHFGLGTNGILDSLVISWPSGHVDSFYDLFTDQVYHVLEGSSMQNEIVSGELCLNGETTLSAEEEYDSYLWNTGDTTQTITAIEPGEYFVEYFNELGVSNTVYYTLDYAENPEVETLSSNVECNGGNEGMISLTQTEGPEISEINWSNEESGFTIDSLTAGMYFYEMVDVNGCITMDTIQITEADLLVVNSLGTDTICHGQCLGIIELEIYGGTGEYTILGDIEELCGGIYDITVLDENLCEAETSGEVIQLNLILISVETTPVDGEELGSATADVIGGVPPIEIVWSNDEEGEAVDNLDVDNYSVTATDALGCYGVTEFEIFTDIFEFNEDLFQIYPNPVTDKLFIQGEIPENSTIEIYSMDGRLVATKKATSGSIDLAKLASASYIVKLVDGERVYTFEIIKK